MPRWESRVVGVAFACSMFACSDEQELPTECETVHEAAALTSGGTNGPPGGSTTSGGIGDVDGIPCDPDPVPDCCSAGGARWETCVGEPARGFAGSCSCFLQLAAAQYGPDCVAALEAFYVCLPRSDCMTIAVGDACPQEIAAISDICPFLSPY